MRSLTALQPDMWPGYWQAAEVWRGWHMPCVPLGPRTWRISYSLIMRTTAAFCEGDERQITTLPHCAPTWRPQQ